MNKELSFLIETVTGAAALITDEFEVKAKDDKGDLVTNFDYEIEEYIINAIKKEYPDFTIVSEEYNSDASLTDNCFTIDPIDGTVNFAHNIPLWGIQVACIKNGKTCAAVINIPKLNELYYADETGAYMNGKPIHVSSDTVEKGVFSVEGPERIQAENNMRKFNRNYRSFYCASVNYAFVAIGRLSGTVFLRKTAWDYVPGMYIVEKAGGYTYDEYKFHVAANSKELLEVMKENTRIDRTKELVLVDKEKKE